MNPEETASSFVRHAFADTYEHMHDDIRWNIVGTALVEGRDAVIAMCDGSAGHLGALRTEFTAFRVRGGPGFVAVDSEATYTDPDGESSRVASCDLFTFTGAQLTEIVSYTVELPG